MSKGADKEIKRTCVCGGGVSEGVWALRHVGGGVRVGSYGGSVKEAREAMVPLVTAGRASAVLL